jgi:hypothetical protein
MRPFIIGTADFNDDGHLDLAVANDAGSGTAVAAVLLNGCVSGL